jgi:hypothetical protein
MMHHDGDVPTTSPLMDRRNFLVATTASLLCAPAIVHASSLMPIKVGDWLASPVNEIRLRRVQWDNDWPHTSHQVQFDALLSLA